LACILARKVIWKAPATTLPNMLLRQWILSSFEMYVTMDLLLRNGIWYNSIIHF
jgi:hypothetical protein